MEPLRIARLKENWTQEQLAKVLDITSVTVSNLERGVTQPAPDTKRKIESLFGCIDWTRTYNLGRIYRQMPNKTPEAVQ